MNAMEKRYPFKFLDAYSPSDSEFFFGRAEEIDSLYKMVFQADLLLVYGASGTGKTSLIQCGLASKFQSHDWLAINVRRGIDLNASLYKALQEASGGSEKNTPVDDLDWLDEDLNVGEIGTGATEHKTSVLTHQFREIYRQHFKPIYLIFDQFEELYILGDKTEQQAFILTVKQILQAKQPVKIILSIREEYLGHLYEFEQEVPALLRKKLRVEPMNLDRVQTVIQGIATKPNSNVRLESGQAEAIAKEIFEKIRGEEKTLNIQLPYLQVFLDKLYLQITNDDNRQAEAIFSLDALRKMGKIGDVLRDFLDEQVQLIGHQMGENPKAIWRILSPFVTLDGTKEPLSEPSLSDRLPDLSPTRIRLVLQALVNSRILRFTEGEALYEIAHDSLAKQVHAKRSDEEIAILEVQRLIKSQTLLKLDAREYFTEKQLLFIEPYLDKFKLNEVEADWIGKSKVFIAKQREAATRHQILELEKTKRQLRTVVGLLAAAVVAVLVAVYFAFSSSREKQMATLAKAEAHANLIKSYESDITRYKGEIILAERHISTYRQYHADVDVIEKEQSTIDSLMRQIEAIHLEIKSLQE